MNSVAQRVKPCQELLLTGEKWSEKKLMNETLSMAYLSVNPSKAERLRDCSTVLQFSVNPDGTKKLQSVNSCHVRLCPICTWRRSLKVYYNMLRVFRYLEEHESRVYIFATLTIRNCDGSELSQAITELLHGYKNLVALKDFKSAFKGTYRGLEITRNANPESESYGTYHPHLHCVFSANKSYFTDTRRYISTDKFRKMWKQSIRADYLPVCHLQKVKGHIEKSLLEVCKYTVKDADYLPEKIQTAEDWELTSDIVAVLDEALHKRRLVAYGGEFALIRKKLKLDDEADLVNVENNDDTISADTQKIVTYMWYHGFRNYYATDYYYIGDD